MDCDSHATFAVTTVRDNQNPVLPSNGVAAFRAHGISEGKITADLLAADAKMNTFLNKIDHKSPMWRWWPVSGSVSTNESDFFEVTGNTSLKQEAK